MRALTSLWTPNTRLYDRADEGNARRRILDVAIGWQNYRDAGVWKPIDLTPQPSDIAGYDWMVPGLPYRPYLSLTGARRVYPDRDDPSRYLNLPAGKFMAGKTFTRLGNSLVWESNRYDVVLRWENSRLKLDVVVKRPIPFDSIEFDIDRIGIDEAMLLSMLRGLKAIDSSPIPIERPLSVSLAGGVLTLGFDLSGMTVPVTIDPTLDLAVGAGADDGVSRPACTLFDNTSTTAAVGVGTTTLSRQMWARFPGASGLSGATITVSYISLYGFATSGTPAADVFAEDAAAPTQMASCADAQGRTLTTASVVWDGACTTGAYNNSPSLNAVIQELADSYDPSVIQILVVGASDNPNTAYNQWRTYEAGSSLWPLLHIEYTAGGAADQEPALIGGKLTQSLLTEHLVR